MSGENASSAEVEPNVHELVAEMGTQLAALQLENETLSKLFTKSDGFVPIPQEALLKIKAQAREIVGLRERNDALLDEKNAAIRDAASWKKKAAKVPT